MSNHAPGDRPSLDIDLDAIRRNYRTVRAAFGGQGVGAVVKQDAYGLGLARIAPILSTLGCTDFWVTDLDEAADLRQGLVGGRIFVLHGLSHHPLGEFRRLGAIPVLAGPADLARVLATAGESRPTVALQFDTGLNRIGLGLSDLRHLLAHPGCLDRLSIAAYVTHLSYFACPDARQNDWQARRLRAWTARLPPAPLSLCASAGVFGPRARHMDLARVGSALYGLETTPGRRQPLMPAATLSAPILRIEDLPAGAEVGYGGSYRTPAPCRLAHVAAGYASGLPFRFQAPAYVRIAAHLAPIVANPSMSLMSVDVSHLPVDAARPGTRVTLFGPDLPVDALAAAAGMPPAAIQVAAGRAVRRTYVDSASLTRAQASARTS